ncbi:MAG: 30S ribosomal protein S24e [Candidatus Methanomethylicota archaeon]|uniref:Small ribosomal subunit protein eS24 n=1 Tax=Thermoproteota archaeon TaxID=2056631 RepID=A0A497EXL6_9CREN|nr:MAG: 30S ribosomal protein S24e [Candidatus Verstraetearchaeota archaeon]
MTNEEFHIEIVEKRRNPLIGRLELNVVIHHMGKGTPKRFDIRKAIADQFNTQIDCVYVRNLTTEYGIGRTIGRIHIYDSAERAKLIEPEYLILRNQPPEEKKEEEQS